MVLEENEEDKLSEKVTNELYHIGEKMTLLNNILRRAWRRRALDRDKWKEVLKAARTQNGL